jgi:hypothetical protein
MPLDANSEKLFRDFEVNVLDVHHQTLPLWQRPKPQALLSLLAQFDCNAILSLLMPGGAPVMGAVQVFKSGEEALTQAIKWFHDGTAIDVTAVIDQKAVDEAGRFSHFAGTYVDIADFHKMYGQKQVDVSVDEVARTVTFSSSPGNPGRTPLSGMAEQTHRMASLPTFKDPGSIEHIQKAAFQVLDAAAFHTVDGRVVLDDLSIVNDPAIVELLDVVFPKEAVLLDGNSDLVGFSLSEFTTYFEAIRRWSLCATFIFMQQVTNGKKQQWECVPTQVVTVDHFRDTMVAITGLTPEKVNAVSQRLTFDARTNGPDLFQQPLLIGPSLVAWSTMVVLNSRYIRNMLKLMSRTAATRDHTATLIGSQEPKMLLEVGQLLSRKGGTQFKLTTTIKVGNEEAEIDLLGFNTKFPEEVLVLEGKAVLGVDEIGEVASATKEMQKGQKQLARSIDLLQKLSLEERQATFKFVQWKNVKIIKGVVVALDAEPNDLYDHSTYPGISLQAIKARLRENHFSSPVKFWTACRDRKWLDSLDKYNEKHVPVKVGNVTYRLPALEEPDELSEARQRKMMAEMLGMKEGSGPKKPKRRR